jgi:hypothetical protein
VVAPRAGCFFFFRALFEVVGAPAPERVARAGVFEERATDAEAFASPPEERGFFFDVAREVLRWLMPAREQWPTGRSRVPGPPSPNRHRPTGAVDSRFSWLERSA